MMKCTKCQTNVASWPNIPGNVCASCHSIWWTETKDKLEELTSQKSELERLGQASLTSIQKANDKINELKASNQNLKTQLTAKTNELNQSQNTNQALTQELTHLKQKHTNYLNQRKAQLTQEIQLIKEALHD